MTTHRNRSHTVSRRSLLGAVPALTVVPELPPMAPSTARLLAQSAGASRRLRISGMELITVRATASPWQASRLCASSVRSTS